MLTLEEQDIETWNLIDSGGINLTIDGTARNLTGLDFTAASNLNGVASIINTALGEWRMYLGR